MRFRYSLGTPRPVLAVASLMMVLVQFSNLRVTAQSVDTVGPRIVEDQGVIQMARAMVDDFMQVAHLPKGLDSVGIKEMTADWLRDYLLERVGSPFFPVANRYVVDSVRAITPEGTILMVGMRTYPDSIPGHGLVEVNWNWFLRQTEEGWRISAVRRTQGMLRAMQTLQLIDTALAYPPSVKPLLVREEGAILLSNRDLRTLYEENRGSLVELVGRLRSNPEIRVLERVGDHPRQVNQKLVDWGMAAHTMTQTMIDEFYAIAPEETHPEIDARMRAAATQREKATLAMNDHLRGEGLRPSAVNEIVLLMKQARIRFINTDIPFSDGVLMTVAGQLEQAIGFLYSPKGELPWINPEEFFYLEELGEGWWIFRSA